MAEGVDLYGLYNKVTDWNAVRAAGIEYAWVKLSDGNTNRDDYGYVAAGKRVGILMGGYHYAQPGDPVAQANRLIDRCTAYGALDLAPALDLEDPFVPGPAAINFAIAFLKQIEARGHVPCLYANQSMLLGILPAVRKAVPNVRVWGARYGAELTMPHDVHQYTSTGRVPGITGDVDRNRGAVLLNTHQEDDMQLNDPVPMSDSTPSKPKSKTYQTIVVEDYNRLQNLESWFRPANADGFAKGPLAEKLDSLSAPVIDYDKLVAALGDGFAEQLAEKVAAKLAARLQS